MAVIPERSEGNCGQLPGLKREDVDIRPEAPSDYDSVHDLDLRAFGRANEADLAKRVRASDRHIPELALVGEEADEVVAHVLFSYVALEADQLLAVLAIALLAVDPRRQGRGHGTGLIHAGLEVADARGEPLVVVEGDHGYYSRFGFEPSSRHGIERPLPQEIPEENFMVRRLSGYGDRYRGTIVFPPAFEVIQRGDAD